MRYTFGLICFFGCLFQGGLFAQQHLAFDEMANLSAINDAVIFVPLDTSSINFEKISLPDSVATFASKKCKLCVEPYPPVKRDFRKLGYNTLVYFGVSTVAFGVLWVSPESFSKWDKKEIRERGILYKWKQNISQPPIIDKDKWQLNYIAHPYCGGLYYLTARSSGFKPLESFVYSFLMSTFFWEYGIEAFAERPSAQDLIITPVLGSLVGEGFYYIKKGILKNDCRILNSRVLGVTTLVLIDPFNTFLDAVGYKSKTEKNLSLAPVGYDYQSGKAIFGLNFTAKF